MSCYPSCYPVGFRWPHPYTDVLSFPWKRWTELGRSILWGLALSPCRSRTCPDSNKKAWAGRVGSWTILWNEDGQKHAVCQDMDRVKGNCGAPLLVFSPWSRTNSQTSRFGQDIVRILMLCLVPRTLIATRFGICLLALEARQVRKGFVKSHQKHCSAGLTSITVFLKC